MNDLNPREMIKIGQQIKVDHCDCPDDQPASYQQTTSRIPATPTNAQPNDWQARGNMPQSYSTNSPRQPQTTAAPVSESFSSDRFNNRQEDELRNTPYFLNRPSVQTPPPASYNQVQPRSYSDPGLSAKGGNVPQGYDTYAPQGDQNRVRTVYIVKDGDSLFNIARNYGTTVQRLREINNLEKNEILVPYQRIYLN